MDIHCKRCREPIPASEVNLDTNMAKCLKCNAVFDFRSQIDNSAPIARREVQAPKNIALQSTMDGLEIVRKWFSPKVYALLVFCIFWDGFMVVWFGIAISQQQWAMAAFGTIHGAVGVGLTYLLICSFINQTHIQISFRDLRIFHKPLPWPGRKLIPLGSIQQIFTQEKVHRGKNGTRYTYEVRYQDTEDKDHKLVSGLESADHALYIEQEIEKTLGIEDTPVSGELDR